ncbi:MAG: hypothetical protein EXR69_06730 [Myxococcales bacterium]|nr:hypothetical protein [Myxococcales bacterium]
MFVTVDGQALTVAPGRTTGFQTLAGDVSVRATYRQFGTDRVLVSRQVAVPAGRSASVVLVPPSTSLVRVQNEADRSADLMVDGRVVASLAAYQSRLVTLPVGYHDLAMASGAWTIDHERVDVRAFSEIAFVAQMPRVNDVAVFNPLPITVRVVTDSGQTRTLEPRTQTLFASVPIGSFHARAVRLTGELVDELYGTVRPDVDLSLRVDSPSTGLVDVTSHTRSVLTVEIDDRTRRSLTAASTTTLELSLGMHHVEIVDDRGHRVLDTWVAVDPYATQRVYAVPPERRTSSREDEDRWAEAADSTGASGCEHHHER